ncbi:MAG: DUF4445 domain-containing protein [Dehalococcoidia bacterium]|nr:DUF4445 domain-containing protein [Dehalococcoidia bacterium]
MRMKLCQIDFKPTGKSGKCRGDQSLLDCAHQSGVDIVSICGGHGRGNCCKVRVLKGAASEPTANELKVFSPQELEEGWRLACQTRPRDDLELFVPPGSMTTMQRLQVEGFEIAVAPDSPVHSYDIYLPAPSMSDLQADAERILEELKNQRVNCSSIDIEVLKNASPLLRAWDWKAKVFVRGNEVVAIGHQSSRQLGLAVDLGSTKIAAYLMDLGSGKTLAARGAMNPQFAYGDDIVSRLSFVLEKRGGGKLMQKLVIDELNRLLLELCSEVDTHPDEIVEAVMVGNTAMHHLLLKLPVGQLASAPYVPAVKGALDIKARDLGLNIAAGAYVHILPNIAGFVGADHVAMLLATKEIWQKESLALAIDIGTNSEVSLIDSAEIASVSCASGPAFEGAAVKNGMRAAAGAIERLRISGNAVDYLTIDKAKPIGICGSGILDAIAQLRLAGVVDKSGRMLNNHARVRDDKMQREFIISKGERNELPAITITQKDVRAIQLAKGALRSGIQALLNARDHSSEEIKKVIIAGAFGSYIDVSSAIITGMLPSLPLNRFEQVGNAAGMGAKLALVSGSKRAEAQSIASKVHYIELAAVPDYVKILVEAVGMDEY